MVEVVPTRMVVLANVAIFVANLIFAVGNVVGTITLAGINPILFALIREAVAGPLLCAVARLEPSVPLRRQDMWGFLLVGSTLYANNLCFILGNKLAGATATGVWQPAQPVFVTLMAIFFKYEEPRVLKFVGIAIAAAGCLIIVLLSAETHSSKNALAGNICLFTQAVVCSGYYVSQKPLLERYSPTVVIGYAYMVATVFMTLTAVVANNVDAILNVVCDDCNGGWHIPSGAWAGIAYWVFIGSIAGYMLMTWGNKYVEPSLLGIYTVVQPVGTVLTAALVIATTEAPHWGLTGLGKSDLGAIGVVVGLVIVVYDNRANRPEEELLLPSKQDHTNAQNQDVGEQNLVDGCTEPVDFKGSPENQPLQIKPPTNC